MSTEITHQRRLDILRSSGGIRDIGDEIIVPGFTMHDGRTVTGFKDGKPVYATMFNHTCLRCGDSFSNILEKCDYCCVCEVRNQRDEWGD